MFALQIAIIHDIFRVTGSFVPFFPLPTIWLHKFSRVLFAMSSPSDARASARSAHLALIRAMPASQYVATQTAEVLAAALVASPAVMLVTTVSGVLSARFPRPLPPPPGVLVAPAAPVLPPIPRTAGGLLAAGLRSGARSTAGLAFWAAGVAAASAAAREALRVGPRHEDAPAAASSRTALWINAAAGGAVAYAALGAAAGGMTPPRRLLYATMGSMGGVLLPQFMAAAGPGVRRQLVALLGAPPQQAADQPRA
jgi:hypothetical protein